MKLTKKTKQIVSCANPQYGNFASNQEIKTAKLFSRGHYWKDEEFENYVSMSLTGRKKFFEYSLSFPTSSENKKYWLLMAKRSASLWAQGKYKAAIENDEKMWNQYRIGCRNEVF